MGTIDATKVKHTHWPPLARKNELLGLFTEGTLAKINTSALQISERSDI
jgi:hypothetical protein